MKKLIKRIRDFFKWEDIGLHRAGSIEEELGKYPFTEGDDYYTIEGNDIVWSCWDEQNEELYTKEKVYFATVVGAKEYAHLNGININKVWDYNGTYKIK